MDTDRVMRYGFMKGWDHRMEWVYEEENLANRAQRQEYQASLEKLIEQRRRAVDETRTAYAQHIREDVDAARQEFVKMLGWPLTEYRPAQPCSVKSEQLFASEEMTIDRVQLELWPDFWFGGLVFRHRDGEKRPFMISQHGGAGTPELCSGLLPMGSVNYNGMTKRAFEMGANIFAPQVFLWSVELFGGKEGQEGKERDEIRRPMDVSLKNLGGSMIAVEMTCLRRCVDYFAAQPWVCPEAMGMVGLSYGGQYTLFFSAIEPRIKAALSSCYFNDRHKVEWSDYTWFDAGEKFFDAEIAMLSRPRRLFIQAGSDDPGFLSPDALHEWERLQKLSADDLTWVDFNLFKGEHEFDKDDRQLRAVVDLLKAAL